MNTLTQAMIYVVVYMAGALATAILLERAGKRSARVMRGEGYSEEIIRQTLSQHRDNLWLSSAFWPISLVMLAFAATVGLFRG